MKKNSKKVILVGNWKMNPSTMQDAQKRIVDIQKAAATHPSLKVIICPPFPFIAPLAWMANNGAKTKGVISIGAQDASIFENGTAHTGDVSALMSESAGAKYVILGHSERRAMGDTGQVISHKIQQALKTNMDVIICIGEKVRDADGGYLEVIKTQLKEVLMGINRQQFQRIILAYEPVWAIGSTSNQADSPYDLHQMVVYIRKCLREMFDPTISTLIPILYGGSANPGNAEDIICNGEVDGLLIGRASWTAESFSAIFDAIRGGDKALTTSALKETLRKAKSNRQKRYTKGKEKKSLKQIAKVDTKKSSKKPKATPKKSKKTKHASKPKKTVRSKARRSKR